MVFSGAVDDTRSHSLDQAVVEAVDPVTSAHFGVGVRIHTAGRDTPARRRIAGPLAGWLEDLDSDQASAPPLEIQSLQLALDDWRLEFLALPVVPGRRDTARPVWAFGPDAGGIVDDESQLRETLEKKRRQHGRPEIPYLIAALLVSPFFDRESVENALFGSIAFRFRGDDPGSGKWVRQRDGFWIGERRPRGTRVSAVLTASGLQPWTVGRIWPRIWHNPFAAHPMATDLGLPSSVIGTDGRLEHRDLIEPPSVLFDLPANWPGPEGPFDR